MSYGFTPLRSLPRPPTAPRRYKYSESNYRRLDRASNQQAMIGTRLEGPQGIAQLSHTHLRSCMFTLFRSRTVCRGVRQRLRLLSHDLWSNLVRIPATAPKCTELHTRQLNSLAHSNACLHTPTQPPLPASPCATRWSVTKTFSPRHSPLLLVQMTIHRRRAIVATTP